MSSFERPIFEPIFDGFKNSILSIRNQINVDVIGACWTTDTSDQPEEEKSSDK